MHSWGDEWFNKYGNDLSEAENWIQDKLYKKTRCRLISKEKYGTIRYEWLIPPYGTVCNIRSRLQWHWVHSKLYRKWQAWAWKTLLKVIMEAIEKWPHLEDELLSDIAIHEALVGKVIHNKYWKSL